MKKSFMRRKHYLLHTVSLTGICIVLLFINNIFAFTFNHTLAPYKGHEIKNTNSEVFLGLDRILGNNAPSETLLINGWALCATDADNDEKYIQIVLKKGDEFYYYDPIAPNERTDLQITGMKGVNHGFSFYVSTLNLTAGIYEIFVHCFENETNHGIVSTNYQLVKNKNGILVKNWSSQEVRLAMPENGDFFCSLDTVSLTEDKVVSLTGWAYLPGIDSAQQKLYLEITDAVGSKRTFDTHKVYRGDLIGVSDKAVNAGFGALLELNSISVGKISVRIILESGGQYFRSTDELSAVLNTTP